MSRPAAEQAQVIVVGAGPGGSTAAWHLARQGLSVALVEKSEFPREKVCGDGLTPRAVRQLVRMGIDTSAPGWMRNRGLRFVSRGRTLELDWPESSAFPAYGLTRTREDFDQLLARHAEAAGARLHTRTKVTAPLLDRAGRVVGVSTTGPEGRERDFTAPLVVAADGVAGRLAVSMGIERLKKRPVGTAVRRYFRSQARHLDPYLESWLDLRREDGRILPGYSWIFPLGDGRVNVGLGVLNDSRTGSMQTRRLLETWLARTPAAWGLREDGNADGPLRGAALPMGFNRLPHYRDGLLLIGDAGGMVNPCNGEGITYAMESAELAADVAGQALARPAGPARERALEHYPAQMAHRLGRYYRLGRGFSALMARPAFTSLVTQNAVRSPAAMRFMVRLLSNLTDRPGTDAMDHLVNALIRVTPSPADHAGRFAGAPSLRRSRSRVPG